MPPPDSTALPDFEPTPRTRIKRLHELARYDRETVYAILDAGLLCHVGYLLDGQPYVTPTAYWRQGDQLYWHGSSASRMLRGLGTGIPCCVTVSILDGLVLARSGYNSTINYRSVMALGRATPVGSAEDKLAALEAFSERLTPGRWAEQRAPTAQELKATSVLSMTLDELAAKVSSGPPSDDAGDYEAEVWAGEVPLRTVVGTPVDDPRLKAGIAPPDYLAEITINALEDGP